MCVSEQLVKGRNRCAAAGIEPATSSRKSNALTTTPPSHTPSTTILSQSFVEHFFTSYIFPFYRLNTLRSWVNEMTGILRKAANVHNAE